jgi:hypothetical protein
VGYWCEIPLQNKKQLRPQSVFYNRLSLLFAGHQAVYAIEGVFCQRLSRLMFCTPRIIWPLVIFISYFLLTRPYSSGLRTARFWIHQFTCPTSITPHASNLRDFKPNSCRSRNLLRTKEADFEVSMPRSLPRHQRPAIDDWGIDWYRHGLVLSGWRLSDKEGASQRVPRAFAFFYLIHAKGGSSSSPSNHSLQTFATHHHHPLFSGGWNFHPRRKIRQIRVRPVLCV